MLSRTSLIATRRQALRAWGGRHSDDLAHQSGRPGSRAFGWACGMGQLPPHRNHPTATPKTARKMG
jgi:hypothetical protein